MIVIEKLTQLLAKTGQGMQANSDLTDIEFIVNESIVTCQTLGLDGMVRWAKFERDLVKDSPDKWKALVWAEWDGKGEVKVASDETSACGK